MLWRDIPRHINPVCVFRTRRVSLHRQVLLSVPRCTGTSRQFVTTNLSSRVPLDTDVLIVGGGAMGSSTAYWLKILNKGLNVTVVESDPTYSQASSPRSVGGIRQQFSTPENIQLSMRSFVFLRDIGRHLAIPGQDVPNIDLRDGAYLLLATEENSAQAFRRCNKIQIAHGAQVVLLNRDELKSRYEWLYCDDVSLASIGTANEGFFDPWAFLQAFRKKSTSLGVNYVHGDLVGFQLEESQISSAEVKLAHDSSIVSINTHLVVNAAGAWSGDVAKLSGIGTGTGTMSIPLPVEPKKRYVYIIHCPQGPINLPGVLNDVVYIKKEGRPGHYIVGRCPEPEDEPSVDHLDVDYKYFDDHIWSHLAHRIPAMEQLKVKGGWGGYYDYNTLDQNGIFGNHPIVRNMYFITGFSGHGIQQSSASGEIVAEFILTGRYKHIDLTRLEFQRFIDNKLVVEDNIL